MARQARAARRASAGPASSSQVRAPDGSARTGGDRGGRGGKRQLAGQLPYWIVLAGVIAGLATVGGGGQAVRGGTLVIAGALLAGSLARLALPEGKAGMLGSRRRLVDVAVLAAFGVGLLIAGLILKAPAP